MSNELEKLVSIGNRKVGKTTAIFNLTSATDCPMKNQCEFGITGKCYALKSERLYPQVLPYRRRQQAYWESKEIPELTKDFVEFFKKNPSLKYLRFNESGDATTYWDFMKMHYIAVALMIADMDVHVYTYTHNVDAYDDFVIRWGEPCDRLHVNISTVDYLPYKVNRFLGISLIPADAEFVCKGKGCGTDCTLCSRPIDGKTVYCRIH